MSAVERLEALAKEMATRSPLSTQHMEMENFIAQANEARRQFEDAAKDYRSFHYEEMKLEAERPVVLEEIKVRVSKARPALAATNVEKEAKVDPAYLYHLTLQRDTVRIKDDHWTRMESARLRCLTAIAALKATGGLI